MRDRDTGAALACQGYNVTGTDISAAAIERARDEAASWDVAVSLAVADVRSARA